MPPFSLLRLILSGVLLISVLCTPLVAAQSESQVVRIAVKEFPPLVLANNSGLCIDLARLICKRHNLVPEFVMYETVPAFLESVEQGDCDLGFAGITITAEREKRLDFSQPFFDSGLMIGIRADQTGRFTHVTMAILRVLGVSLLLFLVGLTLVAHLIWWFERDDASDQAFSRQYRKGIIDAYWWAVVTMTTVGYGDKCPRRVAGRIIASVWMIVGIMWFAAFTATLSTTMTMDRIHPGAIKSLADLSGRRVAIIAGTTTEEFLRFADMDLVRTASLAEMIDLLKKEHVDAIIYDAPPLLYTAKNDPSVRVVGEMFARQRYGVVFPEQGQEELKEIFNREIIKLRQSGTYQQIYDKWFK
jgi:polar amino acid transport system substrate-binding protein